MRRPLRRTTMRGGVSGRVHRPGPRTFRNPAAIAGQAAAAATRRGDMTLSAMLRRSALLLVLLSAPAFAATPAAGDAPAAHPPGVAIASAHELATQAGLDIIKAGGNAFDAAIAVSSTLSVVAPISPGQGGGGFCRRYDAKSGT